MSEGLEEWMGRTVYNEVEDADELRQARADEHERQLDEAYAGEAQARSNLRRTEVNYYKYGRASRADLFQAKQDAVDATARRADLEEGS